MQVLVIDPVFNMGHVFRGILSSLNCSPVFVTDHTFRGYRTLLDEPIDLIVCDVASHPVNGLSFAKGLRWASDSKHRDIPIILTTIDPDPKLIFLARDAGVNHVLTKPCSVNAVQARLSHIFERTNTFIECAAYVGPDRRRKNVKLSLPSRRKTDHTATKPEYTEKLWDLIKPPKPPKPKADPNQPREGERRANVSDLREGMVLTRAYTTSSGLMVAAEETLLTQKAIGRIRDLASAKKADPFAFVQEDRR